MVHTQVDKIYIYTHAIVRVKERAGDNGGENGILSSLSCVYIIWIKGSERTEPMHIYIYTYIVVRRKREKSATSQRDSFRGGGHVDKWRRVAPLTPPPSGTHRLFKQPTPHLYSRTADVVAARRKTVFELFYFPISLLLLLLLLLLLYLRRQRPLVEWSVYLSFYACS